MSKRVKNTLSGSEVEGRTEEHKKRGKHGKRGKRDELFEPLNAWACLLGLDEPRNSGVSLAREGAVMWRIDVVRLEPTPEQEKVLWGVDDETARLVNMENYRRRQLFFEGKGIDCSCMSTWK